MMVIFFCIIGLIQVLRQAIKIFIDLDFYVNSHNEDKRSTFSLFTIWLTFSLFTIYGLTYEILVLITYGSSQALNMYTTGLDKHIF